MSRLASPSTSPGLAIASLLEGSWRANAEPAAHAGEALSAMADTLLGTGCGGLVWWRIRGSSAANDERAIPFHEAFRLHTLQAAIHAKNLEHVIGRFNAAGLTPIVFKGWAMARLYAMAGLRPYGDVDVLVQSKDETQARAVIAGLPPELRSFVDLDMRVLRRFLPDRSFAELAARASHQALGGARFLVLAPEDHLRLICLHQMDHGGWRPMWLCDVAAMLESLPAGYQWPLCLAGNPRLSDAVLALVALAEELLGARLPSGTPRVAAPRWLRKAVLHSWACGYQAPPDSLYGLHRLGWRRAFAAVRARWPDPITSTLHLRAPLRGIPRPALQVTECLRRAVMFLRRTWREGTSKLWSAVAVGGEGVAS